MSLLPGETDLLPLFDLPWEGLDKDPYSCSVKRSDEALSKTVKSEKVPRPAVHESPLQMTIMAPYQTG